MQFTVDQYRQQLVIQHTQLSEYSISGLTTSSRDRSFRGIFLRYMGTMSVAGVLVSCMFASVGGSKATLIDRRLKFTGGDFSGETTVKGWVPKPDPH